MSEWIRDTPFRWCDTPHQCPIVLCNLPPAKLPSQALEGGLCLRDQDQTRGLAIDPMNLSRLPLALSHVKNLHTLGRNKIGQRSVISTGETVRVHTSRFVDDQ